MDGRRGRVHAAHLISSHGRRKTTIALFAAAGVRTVTAHITSTCWFRTRLASPWWMYEMTAYVPAGGASCGATGLSTAVTAVATETEAEADVRDIAVCCAVCRSHCSRRTNVHFAPQPGDGQQEHRNYNHHYHYHILHLHLHLHHWQQTTTTTTMTTPRGCHAPWRGRR